MCHVRTGRSAAVRTLKLWNVLEKAAEPISSIKLRGKQIQEDNIWSRMNNKWINTMTRWRNGWDGQEETHTHRNEMRHTGRRATLHPNIDTSSSQCWHIDAKVWVHYSGRLWTSVSNLIHMTVLRCTLPSPTDSMWTPPGLHESTWTPGGLHMEKTTMYNFVQNPSGLHLDSIWNPDGIQVDSRWTPLLV